MTTNNMNKVDEMIAYQVKASRDDVERQNLLLLDELRATVTRLRLKQRLLQGKKEMESMRSSLESSETLVMKLESRVSKLKRWLDEVKSEEAAIRSTNKELKKKCFSTERCWWSHDREGRRMGDEERYMIGMGGKEMRNE